MLISIRTARSRNTHRVQEISRRMRSRMLGSFSDSNAAGVICTRCSQPAMIEKSGPIFKRASSSTSVFPICIIDISVIAGSVARVCKNTDQKPVASTTSTLPHKGRPMLEMWACPFAYRPVVLSSPHFRHKRTSLLSFTQMERCRCLCQGSGLMSS